jgi:hypothetical protein
MKNALRQGTLNVYTVGYLNPTQLVLDNNSSFINLNALHSLTSPSTNGLLGFSTLTAPPPHKTTVRQVPPQRSTVTLTPPSPFPPTSSHPLLKPPRRNRHPLQPRMHTNPRIRPLGRAPPPFPRTESGDPVTDTPPEASLASRI